MAMDNVSANFAPHFAPSPAFVAQSIEQRFPKPQAAGSDSCREVINSEGE